MTVCTRSRRVRPSTTSGKHNNHNIKMEAMLKTKYNRKVTIMEGLSAGRLATKIIRFFKYPKSTIYDLAK